MGRHAWLLAAVAIAVSPARPVGAGDWPMFRCDARRSGACADALPEKLHLQWVRYLPPVRPAWPNEPRLHFDASYQPVAMGKTLFVASPNDGAVRAFETETGRRTWRFHAEGPVRMAPVAWRGKLFAGSDDGYLYCLDAGTGKRLWTLRGAPPDRPKRRHLGNGRLISFWPVRGGPVIADGRIYFAAGIWPTMGVFVVAADAETGRCLWRNDKVNFLADVRLDHNEVQNSGLSPQGHLVVAGGKLLVPNGRSMPAALDLQTGEALYYLQGYRNGDCRVAAVDHYAFVGRSGVIDVRTGREVGSRWAAAGRDAPARFDIKKFHLFEGPTHPYKMVPGCSARSVLTDGVAYGVDRGVFHAYDLRRVKTSEYVKMHDKHVLRPWRWDPASLWRLAARAGARRPEEALIKAGNRLYGHADRTLLAVEIPKNAADRPKLVWQGEIQHTPAEMLAADGKLFVVTKAGAIHCFGQRKGTPKTYPLETAAPPKADKTSAAAVAKILARTQVAAGYGLVLGLGDGHVVEELIRQSKLTVLAVDPDAGKVARLRKRLTAAGVYGTRAEAFVGRPERFGFPPYLASLVVSGNGAAGGRAGWPAAKKLLEILRPYDGVAWLSVPAEGADAYAGRFASAGRTNAQVERLDDCLLLRRLGPLPGSAAWTHECGDAARTFFSKDRRVREPLGILWYGDSDDLGFWKRKDYGIGVKPQVVGGRLFALQLASRTLTAYDVYTGRRLWERKVAPFTRYASMTDGVYVAQGNKCIVCDPATGKPKATFAFEVAPDAKAFVSDIRVTDGVIVIAVAPSKTRAIDKGLWDSKLLVALDRKTGGTLWRREAQWRFNNNALAAGDGMVFCTDSLSPAKRGESQRRGEKGKTTPSTILAIEARTGREKWAATRTNPHKTYGPDGWTALRGQDDCLAYSHEQGVLLAGKGGLAFGFDAQTGRELWRRRMGGSQPWILRGDTFLHQGGSAFEIRTGRPVGRPVDLRRGGCNYAVANPHMILLRDWSICTVDPNDGTRRTLRNIRSGCSNSLIAADGLLNVPNFAAGCICNYPIQTAFAMVTMPETAAWAGRKPTPLAEAKITPLEDLLEPIRKRHNLPALAAAVLVDGHLSALGATGVRKAATHVAVTRNDAFHLGSCTKAMTATLLALLIDRGKLGWDTTLAEALPDLADEMRPEYRKATIRHLLCHRAGLVPNSPPGKSFGEFFRLPGTHVQQRLAYARAILKAPPRGKPGEKYVYSNAGYAVAGAIAERVTKTPWQTLMRKMIFQPLGMKTAGFGAMGTPGKIDQPWQHVLKDGKHQPIGPGQMSDNPVVIGPAGRVHSSLADWAKFVAAHLNGPKGRPCGLRLKRDTWRICHEAAFDGTYAMGWVVAARNWGGGDVLTHAGSNTMNYAVVWMAPKRDFAVLVATNQGPKPAAKACDEAAATLIRHLLVNGR